MSRQSEPHFPYLHGYTNPIVIKALEVIGLPSEIAKLPKSQQCPMAVTLVGELAAVMVNMIVTSLHDGQSHVEIDDLREIHDGAEYRNLRRKLKILQANQSNLHRQIHELERTIIDHELGSNQSPYSVNGPITKSPLAGKFYWNTQLGNPSLLGTIRDQYEDLARRYTNGSREVDICHSKILEVMARIDIKPEFIKLRDALLAKKAAIKFKKNKVTYREKMVCADFTMGAPLLADGVCHLLRNTEEGWWRQFTSFADAEVNSDARSPQKVMLRDSFLNEAILNKTSEALKNKALTLIPATCEVLANPQDYNSYLGWEPCELSQGQASQWRFEIRKDDEFAINWISSRAGKRHPADSYRSWLAGEWGDKSDNPYLIDHETYTFDRAHNELYWCLAQRNGGRVPFVGFFMDEDAKCRWQRRVESWATKNPDYWEWPYVN